MPRRTATTLDAATAVRIPDSARVMEMAVAGRRWVLRRGCRGRGGAEVSHAIVLGVAEAEGAFEVGLGDASFERGGFVFGDGGKVGVAGDAVGTVLVVSDVGEVAEHPREGVVRFKDDVPAEVVGGGVAVGEGEQRIGEAPDLREGLNVDVGLAGVGEFENVQPEGEE